MNQSNNTCPLCKNVLGDETYDAEGVTVCESCFINSPDIEKAVQAYLGQNPTKNINQTLPQNITQPKKDFLQETCYRCKKPLNPNIMGNVEGMCVDCVQECEKLSFDFTKPQNQASIDEHCKFCKKVVDPVVSVQGQDGTLICHDCFIEHGDEEVHEGALTDKNYLNYIIFSLNQYEGSELPEYYQAGYLHFNKKNLPESKAYFVYSACTDFPKPLPVYFSSVVSLNPYQFLITGGCLKNYYTSLRSCLAVVVNKDKNFFNVQFLEELINERFAHTSVILDNKFLYVLGGLKINPKDKTHVWMNDCERFSIEGLNVCLDPLIGSEGIMSVWPQRKKWESIACMNKPRANFNAFGYAGKIYAFGGFSGVNTLESSIERYDPSKNNWELLDLKDQLEKTQIILLASSLLLRDSENIYVLGGTDGTKSKNQVFKIDAKTMEFEQLKTMNKKRAQAQGFISGGKIHVFGGELANLSMETYSIQGQEDFKIHQLNEGLDQESGLLHNGFIGNFGFFVQ